MKKPIIVALDVENRTKASALFNELKEYVNFYKIGLELFLSEGVGLISLIKAMGGKVFLDLKLHDIPNQVARACREMVKLQVDMFTIHTLGGMEMMVKAVESVKDAAEHYSLPCPKVVGVTVLTSLNQKAVEELHLSGDISQLVNDLAALGYKAGLDGVVSSPHDISRIKQNHGPGFIVVAPGIRPVWAKKDDQRRVSTPTQAYNDGADYLVIGRPIIEANKPADAARKILEELNLDG